jgi:hydrogenase maturation protease
MGKSSTLVLGVGNPFRRDDGVGPAVIARLQTENSLDGVDLLDGGIDGLALIDYMHGYEKVLIVDAVNMNAAPGEIHMFSPQEAILSITSDALSTHGFGVAEVIALMEKMDIQVNMQILGIQAKDVTFGEGLSPEIAVRIDDVIELVKKEVTKAKRSA